MNWSLSATFACNPGLSVLRFFGKASLYTFIIFLVVLSIKSLLKWRSFKRHIKEIMHRRPLKTGTVHVYCFSPRYHNPTIEFTLHNSFLGPLCLLLFDMKVREQNYSVMSSVVSVSCVCLAGRLWIQIQANILFKIHDGIRGNIVSISLSLSLWEQW